MTTTPQDHLISNKLYDVLKNVALLYLPAIGALYFALAQIWGLPAGEEVVGTITAIDAFLGTILRLSTASYNASDAKFDGSIDIEATPQGKKVFQLSLNKEPEALEDSDEVLFKVKQQ